MGIFTGNTNITSFKELKYFKNAGLSANAFDGCSNLKEVELPEGLTNIPSYAFEGCTKLEDVNWKEGLLSIGNFAFRYDTALKMTSIPSSVTQIKAYAFAETSIPIVSIPPSATLGGYAFNNASTSLSCKVSNQNLDNTFRGCMGEYLYFENSSNPESCVDVMMIDKNSLINSQFAAKVLRGNDSNVIIIEEGNSSTIENSNGNYHNRDLVDIASSVTDSSPYYVSVYSTLIKYMIFRNDSMSVTGESALKTVFVHSGGTPAGVTASKIKEIGGTEWATAMQELNTTYTGKWFNRCTNVTTTGYTSSYDGNTYAWTDEWADYDIFGIDRPA